jgi:hypothetical protein
MVEPSLTSLINHMVFVLSAARGAEEKCSSSTQRLIINDCEVVRLIKDYFYFRMLLERMMKNK